MRPRQIASEYSAPARSHAAAGRCFNEAEANSLGILQQGAPAAQRQAQASMRPRQIASEYPPAPAHGYSSDWCFNEAEANSLGIRARACRRQGLRPQASMRPRQIASEYGDHRAQVVDGISASMRPRQIASEYDRARRSSDWYPACFNEAEANSLGIPRAAPGRRARRSGFNEAEANSLGIRGGMMRSAVEKSRLQ